MSTQVATVQPRTSLLAKMAARYSVDPDKMLTTLKATAFRGDVSNEQMMALLIVADQFKLNPWTKEIYAFPDRQNGIVPVIGVDGWARIINERPEFDGMEFSDDDGSCTCTIYRKDRQHPIKVTEYLAECRRNVGPWQSHPKRMLRHKAMIQCARLAFGLVGAFDPDEAERIVERDITPGHDPLPVGASRIEQVKAKVRAVKAPPAPATVDTNTGEIERSIETESGYAYTYAAVRDKLERAKSSDDFALAVDMIRSVADEAQRAELTELAKLLQDNLGE
jgi:phage recombination protein Bet